MSRVYLPLIMLILLVIEGTLFQFLTPDRLNQDAILVPRFLIVMVVFIGIFLGRYSSIIYGICFGLLYDVVYTQLLGVYIFGFGIIGYIFALSYKRIQDSIVFQILFTLVAITFFECYQYGLFRMIGITDMPGESFFQMRLIPTLLLNGAFVILSFYPIKKVLLYIQQQANLRER